MGICCSREGGRLELEEAEGWFPWKHDDFLQEQLSGAAGVSMHTKQGWKGVNQDAMAACQGDHLIIANLGDSRAVLCARDSKDRPVAVQLTTDLKPDLPGEAERILSCKGRVFAMDDEPDVPRLWLPDQDAPGLAMARAFGDFCLKNHGLISTPEVYYKKLSEKDDFLVLATDGIWDVLSNKEVVKIVSSASDRAKAAKQLVDRAVRAWRRKFPTSMVDDCAAVCLFLKPAISSEEENTVKPPHALSFTGSFRKALSGGGEAEEGTAVWKALEGVARVNSVIRLPRMLSRRWRSASMDGSNNDQESSKTDH